MEGESPTALSLGFSYRIEVIVPCCPISSTKDSSKPRKRQRKVQGATRELMQSQ